MDTWGRRFGAALGGFALAWSFPPHYGWWWLAPAAVATLTLCVRGQRPGSAAVLGLLFGAVFFGFLLTWMTVVGIDAWIGLAALCAAWLAGLGVAVSWVTRLRGWPLWVACVWVAEEALRDRIPLGGFPWGRLAFVTGEGGLTAYAWLLGAPGVTFATALVGALIAYAVVGIQRASRVSSPRPGLMALSVAVAATLIVFAAMDYLRPLIEGPTTSEFSAVPVAVVQGNVPRSGFDFQGQREEVLRNHVKATVDFADQLKTGQGQQGRPNFVIWPENATDIDPFSDAAAAALIQSAVDAIGVPVLVGAVVTNPKDPSTILNLSIVWNPKTATSPGGPGQTYAKRHPVPFGEYIPFRSMIGNLTQRFSLIPRDFAPGDSPGVLTIAGVTIGVVICFEVAYDQEPRDVINGGGQFLVVQTNNATYGNTGQPEQQLAITQTRAIEHNRTALVAATSGISAVIDSKGRILQRSEEFTQTVLQANAQLHGTRSPSDRLGEWPEWLLSAVALLAVVRGARTGRRVRAAPALAARP